MEKLVATQIVPFLRLFNREGYVLNFKKDEFDYFTTEKVGVPLCQKYGLSMGKSLESFLYDTSEENQIKLLQGLLSYYEEYCEKEYKNTEKKTTLPYEQNYPKLYLKCRSLMDQILEHCNPFSKSVAELEKSFSSEYLSQEIELMQKMLNENPTEAIGKAKELIESCCKTILDKKGIAYDKKWDVGKLSGEVIKILNLLPSDIPSSDPVSAPIKILLGNLRAIPTQLAQIRNSYGSGHGKSASYSGLEARHAKLAVGCSITFITFLWDTYKGENLK